ncbi:ethanolamine ammonia-lyase subunit EutB [Nannocystis sp. RBIL2]|uniref:ethanolamine ammonia-lyase subunit EutB n=1 Tax=Nannocystis sp. RBIL2 TaxID=2996788 RepID=UPI002271832D|nr:ethanolamine ammonia-lyase subunit EutB [Nannocystis sp. RBIL2]MCY1064837.1 ethanolamine ammonia-lyase subunit EutB [Nannocystis sp. RBIL2]
MKDLRPLSEIPAPAPRPDELYTIDVFGEQVAFRGLKRLLGAADHSKAGERHAGLAAATEREREAARCTLASLTLQHLFDRPLTTAAGQIDEVMRVNYDIDLEVFAEIADLTLGELKNRLLRANGRELLRIGAGLTGVMAAALCKLCDVHELVLLASRISCPTRARTRLGAPGTLSSRLQPNHPTDDLRGVTLLVYWGLSIGAGDALLGINPAIDTVENVSALLHHLDRLRRKTGAPTQICVLAHVKTQLACLERGAPVEVLFQSLAGTETTLRDEFDVSVDLLDRAYRTMAERGALKGEAEQFMYFETGQGSELTYGKHEGIDMTTTEALCYGLCRRWDPFMVNNVTGFIGPETHLDNFEMIVSNLQDHFMGKLLGLPMGMAPCYTLHSKISIEGQQIATQLLTAAGANYYMDVCLGTDRMLAYFDTSGHDDQTLREIHGKLPGAELLAWALAMHIFARDEHGAIVRGPRWGDVRRFCDSDAELAELIKATPAVHGFATAGPRPADEVSRVVRLHQAAAREAVACELGEDQLQAITPLRSLHTAASSKDAHLGDPSLGARLSAASLAALETEPATVQILISDGLSAEAVHHNLPALLPILIDGLAACAMPVGVPLLARYGRVKLAEPVAERLGARVVIHLIGERPGGDALASCSLSAYLLYRREDGEPGPRHEYTVISNIHEGGLPPLEAGAVLVEKVRQILEHRAAGNRLESLVDP